MRTVKYFALIKESFNGTISFLFRPYSTKKWMKLLLIASLAGALGGSNFSGVGNSPKQKESPEIQEFLAAVKNAKATDQTASAQEAAQAPAPAKDQQAPQELPVKATKTVIIVVGAIFLFLLFFIVLITWLSCRFRFIWFNTAVRNSDAIFEPYSRHAKESNSLFWFSLAFTLGFLVFLGILAGLTFLKMKAAGALVPGFVWSVPIAFKLFLPPVIFLALAVIALLVLSVIIDNFVVPMMALDASGIGSGLKKFGGIFGAEWPDIVVFLLLLLVLGIVSGAAQTALLIVLFLVVLLAGALVFGIPFLLIWALFKAKIVFITYAVIAGIPFIALALLAFTAMGLPFALFFRILTIKYLVSLNAGYTQESLEMYKERKAEHVSRKGLVLLIVTLLLIGTLAVGGLLAAIAIPNFIKARETALEKQRSAAAQTSVE